MVNHGFNESRKVLVTNWLGELKDFLIEESNVIRTFCFEQL